MERKVIEVEWFDAQSSMEVFTMKEIEEELVPLKSKSVGYLLLDKPKYIVLGFLDFGNGLIKHHQVIPKGMIEKKRFLK